MRKNAYGHVPVEDVLYEMLMGDGARPYEPFSLDPVFKCFLEAVLTTRQQERQAILDAFLATPKPKKKGQAWKAGYSAAYMVMIGIFTDRARAESPQETGPDPSEDVVELLHE